MVSPKELKAEGSVGLASPSLVVLEASIGSGIKRGRRPLSLTEKNSEFVCDNHKVYFFTRIMTPRKGRLPMCGYGMARNFTEKRSTLSLRHGRFTAILSCDHLTVETGMPRVRDMEKVLARLSFQSGRTNSLFSLGHPVKKNHYSIISSWPTPSSALSLRLCDECKQF